MVLLLEVLQLFLGDMVNIVFQQNINSIKVVAEK